MQFLKLYDSRWLVTTDVCSINLVEEEANETPRDTIFIHEAPYRENLRDLLVSRNIILSLLQS